ncbi:hypothetical protein PPYR_02026 [Photinus pyralis]|uniref:HECT-type E3 ubiquitin transferase n=1 Tax=Photinus pyralis TaxID=7054 RepID=A0A5N4B668_PHOPY|nr:G2/M phase-specific E3 ubiquitin-protein ligase-like [Photinus pyralis]KAB0805056.1 hypothetical protein PPYR_02026 [Photinus pyralis]
MRRKTFNPLHKISVKFSDYEGNAEGAIDAGGPSREMFRLVLEYLKNSELFTGKNKKHITLNNRCIQDNLYVEAGKIIALSLVHGGPGPHFFSQTLFSLLAYGHENTVPTLDDVDEDIRTAIVKLQELEILSDLQEMLISENIFSIAGCQFISNMNEKHTIITDTVKFYAIKRIENPLNQLIEGLSICGLYEQIRLYPHLFENLFCQEKSRLTADSLECTFVMQYSEVGSNKRLLENRAMSYFRDFLADCEEDETIQNEECQDRELDEQRSVTLTDVLIFATGADVLPPLGFPVKPTIQFLHGEDSRSFPMANTCGLEFKLPTCHSTYEQFKENMNFAIGNCKSFGFA